MDPRNFAHAPQPPIPTSSTEPPSAPSPTPSVGDCGCKGQNLTLTAEQMQHYQRGWVDGAHHERGEGQRESAEAYNSGFRRGVKLGALALGLGFVLGCVIYGRMA